MIPPRSPDGGRQGYVQAPAGRVQRRQHGLDGVARARGTGRPVRRRGAPSSGPARARSVARTRWHRGNPFPHATRPGERRQAEIATHRIAGGKHACGELRVPARRQHFGSDVEASRAGVPWLPRRRACAMPRPRLPAHAEDRHRRRQLPQGRRAPSLRRRESGCAAPAPPPASRCTRAAARSPRSSASWPRLTSLMHSTAPRPSRRACAIACSCRDTESSRSP